MSVEEKLDLPLDALIARDKPKRSGSGTRGSDRDRKGGFGKTRRAKRHDAPSPYKRKAPRDKPRGGGFRVFVGNLANAVKEAELRASMEPCGKVSDINILRLRDGRSKGCALVEFTTAKGMRRAMKELNDLPIRGRPIFVREDREAVGPTQSSQKQRRGEFKSSSSDTTSNVYIGNLPYEIDWRGLKDLCSTYGHVRHADVEVDSSGRSRGYGIVKFDSKADAAACIDGLNDTSLNDRPLFAKWDRQADAPFANQPPNRDNQTRLYVGNIPFDISWQDLKDHFRDFNAEFAETIETKQGRRTGFGIVSVATKRDARNAITQLDGSELQGRVISVRYDNKV